MYQETANSSSIVAVRLVEAIAGIVIPLVTSRLINVSYNDQEQKQISKESVKLSLSLLHDIGTFCILLALTRALFHALDIWDRTLLNILRRLWGWIHFFLPIPGYFLVVIVLPFRYGDDNAAYDSKRVNGWSEIAYSILKAYIISLGVGLIVMLPFFLCVTIKRRAGQLWSSSTAFYTAVIFLPTFILMIAYLVNDMLRFIISHNPTTTQYFALSLAPEILVTGLWLILARHIGKCDKETIRQQEAIRELTATRWDIDINNAFEAHKSGVRLPGERHKSAEQTLGGVYDCVMYRLERLLQNFLEDEERATRNLIEESQLLVEDAKRNAEMIASCLILTPCESCPLFGAQFLQGREGVERPLYSVEKTGKLVLKVLVKEGAKKILNKEELHWAVSDIVRIHLL